MFSNQITGYTASTIAASVNSFQVQNNLLPTTAIDQILSDVADSEALSHRIGVLYLHGTGNEAPTDGPANVNVVYLLSQGWTVLHN